FAPVAAARAAGSDSKREAAAQYARALRFADHLGVERRAELLEEYAYARYLIGEFDEATDAQQDALASFRELGDARREGQALWLLSRLLRYAGRPEVAMQAGRDAI